MASTLMYIKSRELLPSDQQVTAEGEDDAEDPRWELIRQLVEYKKFKDAAAQLQTLEERQANIFPRLPCKPSFDTVPASKPPQVGLFDLINAVNAILKRVNQREDLRDIFEDKWTVSEKIEHLRRLLSTRGRLRFSELFAGATSRSEIVCTFLALLELMRLRHLVAFQSVAFGDIEIEAAPLADPEVNPGQSYAAALASENLGPELPEQPLETSSTPNDTANRSANEISTAADNGPA
jgi:segregation and condensation protein A